MVCFPQPVKWLGFYRAAKQRQMKNQEEKETSLEYFHDKVMDSHEFYWSVYQDVVDAYNEAKKMYEEEIAKAFEKGYEEGVKYTDGLISDERFPF